MTVEGMDLDGVRSLARAMTRAADRYERLKSEIDAAMAVLAWLGSDAKQVKHEWSSVGRVRLGGAAAELREVANRLHAEVGQQEQASDAAGAGAIESQLLRSMGGGIPAHDSFSEGYGILNWIDESLTNSAYAPTNGVLSLLKGIGTVDKSLPYGKAYEYFTGGAEFFKYNKSPILFNSEIVQGLARSKALGALGLAGAGFTLVKDGSDIYNAFLNPNPSQPITAADKVNAVGGAAADVLKTSHNPVLYLGGVATAAVTMDVAEATKIDWTPNGMTTTFDYIGKNPGELFNSLGDATKEVFGKRIWKVLA